MSSKQCQIKIIKVDKQLIRLGEAKRTQQKILRNE